MGRLTTHVLATARGRPASKVPVFLFRVGEDSSRSQVSTAMTNEDGRTNAPLLEGESLQVGTYELCFHVKEYLDKQSTEVTSSAFFDVISLRFIVGKAAEHYHVPLLLTPWSYSTYRGS